MKKEHRIAFRSVLELVALGGIKVDTALRRTYAIIETIEAEKSTKVEPFVPVSLSHYRRRSVGFWSGIGRCTRGSMPLMV